MSTDIEVVVAEQPRSEVVRLQIMQLSQTLHKSFVVLGRLLKEARDESYHLQWGYQRWGQWVEEASGLDMSERTAYDFVKIIEVADRLQLPDSDLEQVKVSSLKVIASLPEDTDPETVKALLEDAKTLPFKTVREVVGQMKNEGFVYHSLKFSTDVEDNVYQPGLERCRREYGNTMSPSGEPADISDSRCVEMIFADYLSSGEDNGERQIIDAEWEDVVSTGPEA